MRVSCEGSLGSFLPELIRSGSRHQDWISTSAQTWWRAHGYHANGERCELIPCSGPSGSSPREGEGERGLGARDREKGRERVRERRRRNEGERGREEERESDQAREQGVKEREIEKGGGGERASKSKNGGYIVQAIQRGIRCYATHC